MKDEFILDEIVKCLEEYSSSIEEFDPSTFTYKDLEDFKEQLDAMLFFIKKSRIQS